MTESLDAIFKSEGRILEKSAVIDLSVEVFPYDSVFTWVRTLYYYYCVLATI